MSEKDRLNLPRQKMPEQEPSVRRENFNEVPLGYTPEQAKLESERCLQCKKPMCVAGCPVGIDIPGFISLIAQGDFLGAGRKLKETNSLPAICGRVCPQEEQCEKVCVLGKKHEPVAIGNLERFAADYARERGVLEVPNVINPTGKRVAVVGSGPAGLACAGELAKMGYAVTVFEALHKHGGVLTYGIPEFRLPKAIVSAEVGYLKKLGVEIRTNYIIGKTETVDELLSDSYQAVFIGSGAGLPVFLNIPGENLGGVYSANEFLTRVNLMKAYLFPDYDTPVIVGKKVAVIGAGNTALDSARTALRLGPDEVYIVYRRSRQEMPARREEVKHGEEEGIIFHFLTNPLRFLGDEKGHVRSMECVRMELGEPDSSGRRRPVPIPGSEFQIEVNTVIVAVGNNPHPLISQTTPGLATAGEGTIIADPVTGRTQKDRVYAGGDIVTGAATVISAMGVGKRCAKAIDEFIRGLSG